MLCLHGNRVKHERQESHEKEGTPKTRVSHETFVPGASAGRKNPLGKGRGMKSLHPSMRQMICLKARETLINQCFPKEILDMCFQCSFPRQAAFRLFGKGFD